MKNKDCSDCKDGDLCKKHSIEEIERALQSLENDPQLPSDIFEHSSNSNSSNDDGHDSDDDIEVVKADIYKFHGQEETSLDQQVNDGILKFEFRDEDDDDILEIDVIDKRAEKRELVDIDKDSDDETDDDEEEESDRILSCEECGKFVKQSEFSEHKEDMHPAKKKKFKQFQNGMFMMLAE